MNVKIKTIPFSLFLSLHLSLSLYLSLGPNINLTTPWIAWIIQSHRKTKPNSIDVFTDASTYRRVYSVFTLVCYLAFSLLLLFFHSHKLSDVIFLPNSQSRVILFLVYARVWAPVYVIWFFSISRWWVFFLSSWLYNRAKMKDYWLKNDF